MPRFTYPIDWRIAQPDPNGPVRIRMVAWLPIEVRTATENEWRDVQTIVDTGASFSFILRAVRNEPFLP